MYRPKQASYHTKVVRPGIPRDQSQNPKTYIYDTRANSNSNLSDIQTRDSSKNIRINTESNQSNPSIVPTTLNKDSGSHLT